jgi:hypothetical protein
MAAVATSLRELDLQTERRLKQALARVVRHRRAGVRHGVLGALSAAPFVSVGGLNPYAIAAALVAFLYGFAPAAAWRRQGLYRVLMAAAATVLTLFAAASVLAYGFGLLLLPAVATAWLLTARPPTNW